MARIVVTGGAGFLGSHLSEALLARGDEVVCVDNLSTGSTTNIEHLFGRKGFTFVEHNVSEYVWVPGAVDAVMHLASPASPRDYLEMPIQTLKVGSLGTSMMYRSATVQANLDFADEADMIRKMRVSLALQPIFTALFAILIVPFYGWLVARVRRAVLLPAIYGFMSVAFVGTAQVFGAGNPDPMVARVFYVAISVMNLLLVSAFWSFMLEILSSDPYGEGWIAKIKLAPGAGTDHLLSYDAYQKQCAEEGH